MPKPTADYFARLGALVAIDDAARYAAEHPEANLAHARLVTASIARGRVARIDTGAAEAAGAGARRG